MAATTTMRLMKKAREEAERANDAEAPAPALADLTPSEPEEKREYSKNPLVCLFQALIDLLNSMALQTLLYAAFVFVFQLLTSTMRAREEFYLCVFATFLSPPRQAQRRASSRTAPRASRL